MRRNRAFLYSYCMRCFAFLFFIATGIGIGIGVAHAQPTLGWQGEWGGFADLKTEQGSRLSIHDCDGKSCRFSLVHRAGKEHTETAQDETFTLDSPATATATLPGESGSAPCVLHFKLGSGGQPAIEVVATGRTCSSYYGTSAAVSMSGTYPLRARVHYIGDHADECVSGNSPAKLATCTHPELAALEDKWESLAGDYSPEPKPQASGPHKASPNRPDLFQQDAAILHACDASPDPAQCLNKRYSSEIAVMQSKKSAYLQTTENRGDPAEGGRLALKIAGSYRHTFRNGDVQGDKYNTTDTLTIRPVGPASIHFDAELNFYNGHTCSLAGGALFRQDGTFVFDDKPENASTPDAPICRLAIIPIPSGVEFKDITGTCRDYCGMRGGWNGEQFTFNERVQTPPAGKAH